MPRAKCADVVVVAAAFWMNAFELGPLRSIGPFFIEFQENLNASASQASLASSLMYGSYFGAGPFASVLTYYLEFRSIILLGAVTASSGAIVCCFARSMIAVQLLSVMIGFGCGLGIVPKFTIVGNRFTKKRSLANNLVSMGSCLMAIPLPIIVQYWNTQYTWRGSILLIGGLFLNLIPSGMLLTVDTRRDDAKEKKRKSLNPELLKNWKFICYMIACGCDIASITTVNVYLVRFAQAKGYGDYMAASMTSINGVINLTFRPISGYITSKSSIASVPIVRPYILAIICVVQACVVSSMTFSDTLSSFVALVIAFSVCAGCRGALTITMVADFFGTEALVTSLGVRSLSQSVFTTMLPPLVGTIVDATNSYNPPFYGSAIASIITLTLIVLIHKTVKRPGGDVEDIAIGVKGNSISIHPNKVET